MGASRVGISTDPVYTKAKFVDLHEVDYPLLPDADGTVAGRFGVKRGLVGKVMPVKRTTFVIDTDRTVLDRDLRRIEHGHPCGGRIWPS